MEVKKIVEIVASLIELKEIEEYFKSESTEPSTMVVNEINNLVLAVNLSNNIVATKYLEIIDSREFECVNNQIAYADISTNGIIEIKGIYSLGGKKVKYKKYLNYIELPNGEYTIEFSRFPSNVSIDDTIDYYPKLNEYLFAECVASEYLFLKGYFDDASIWEKKFDNSMKNVLRVGRNIVTPARKWV